MIMALCWQVIVPVPSGTMYQLVLFRALRGDEQPTEGPEKHITFTANTSVEDFEQQIALTFNLNSAPVQLQVKHTIPQGEGEPKVVFSGMATRDVCASLRDPSDLIIPRKDGFAELYVLVPEQQQSMQQQQQQLGGPAGHAASSGAASTASAARGSGESGSRGGRAKTQLWMEAVALAASMYAPRDGEGLFILKSVPLDPPADMGEPCTAICKHKLCWCWVV